MRQFLLGKEVSILHKDHELESKMNINDLTTLFETLCA